MPATEVTEEIKNDLEVLQMRGALDPKRFYKKNANKELPKYFQVGRYVNNPVEFYSDRGKFDLFFLNLKVDNFQKVYSILWRSLTDFSTQHYCHVEFSFKFFERNKRTQLSESYQPELINLKKTILIYFYF